MKLSPISFSKLKSYDNKLKNALFEKQLNYMLKKNSLTNLIFLENLMIYFQYFGSFFHYYLIRKVYLQKLIYFQINSKIINLNSLRACLELDKPDLAIKFIKTKKKLKIRTNHTKQLKEIEEYSKFLLTNGKKKIKKISDIADKKYLKFISKSEMLIVGPLKININKSYHNKVIVITNDLYLPKDKKNNFIVYFNLSVGHRILASYHNYLKNKQIKKILEILDTYFFSCFKSNELIEINKKKIIKDKWYDNKRIFFKADSILLNSVGPNMIQNITYDLLIHNPKKISLTGVSFYLEKILYDKNYIKRKSLIGFGKRNYKKKIVYHQLKKHDPISNFTFIRNLWKRKIINVTDDVKKILELSEASYSLKLDRYNEK